jgi:hypothetical protein
MLDAVRTQRAVTKLKQTIPDAPVPKQFLKNVSSFQTTDPISYNKRTQKTHAQCRRTV